MTRQDQGHLSRVFMCTALGSLMLITQYSFIGDMSIWWEVTEGRLMLPLGDPFKGKARNNSIGSDRCL